MLISPMRPASRCRIRQPRLRPGYRFPIDYLLSIRKATGPGATNMYRLVAYNDAGDSGGTVELKDRVLLDGCLKAQSRDTGEIFMFVFWCSCTETAPMADQD